MKDKKLTLRVMMKLMVLATVVFLAYVFFAAFMDDGVDTLVLDISGIAPGEVQLLDAGKRKLLVLHRSPEQVAALRTDAQTETESFRSQRPEYFVAWAYDPFFGCAIEYKTIFFKSVCVNSHFDLAGRAFMGGVTDQDLDVPDYQFVDDGRIRVQFTN